ncbi:Sugar transporter, conserved site,Major facilitator superfamily domain,Major facilitator, sugar [Cinara cedri]|uniref:Sugar transporter, conserved site,Major facilitator superfamily domain,Major facilitator, sugar n=1 Tax=Cinara cedri TaxID=506608 RepID=A0A5E4NF91_9HEMI|nr:Sugar transporter, conserved site,Major facilitator superfamily domain,Major facilitator, sugar [Cinara cedri]
MFKSGTHRQVFATVAASMSIFISGMWLGWPSSVGEKFAKHQTDVEVTYDELSWIVCLMDLGNFISPVFAGYMMDTLGRKLSIVVLGPLFIVSWLLTLYVPSIWALYGARLMAGIGKGMSYTVVPVFLGEIAGVKIRGALGSVFTIQLSSGFLFEVIVGPFLTYRTLNKVSAVMPVLFFLMFLWMPESPYYLLKKGREAKAAKCLQWYRCDSEITSELHQMDVNVQKEMENQATFYELFTNRKNFKALMVVVTACIAQRAGGISCLLAYSPLFLPEPAPIIGKFEYIMIFATMLVVVNFIGLALVDKVGRKPLLIFSEVSSGLITFTFGVYYFLKDHAGLTSFTWLPYLCHFSFAIALAIGVGFIPVVFLGEMFPVNVRSHCSAIASITMALASFVSNKIFLVISRTYGYYTMFWGFTVVNFICAYFAYRYAVETTGKTFQEIQDILEESVKNDDRQKSKAKQNDEVKTICCMKQL